MVTLQLTLLVACCMATHIHPGSVVVRTIQGKLRGDSMVTFSGKPFFAFRGVRYAEPPTGDYRFKPPLPVRPWGEEVRDAIKDGPVCPQPFAEEIGLWSAEDCLFLNVFTKEVSRSAQMAVMVFLQPGGDASLTGTSCYGPQYLLDKDVVLVTFNYRLGALGFVSTGDGVLPGNYGLKDQVAALQWVRDNIAEFGGDPSRVTLVGHGTGSASVMLHLLSPMSKGTFQRAILMSGSALSGWALSRRPQDLSTRLALNLGCPTSDSRLIYACLMQHSAHEIIKATSLIKDFEFSPIALFAPVIEKGGDRDSFLSADPLDLISSGQVAAVPLLVGVTRDEFAARAYYVLQSRTLTAEFDKRWEYNAPVEFMYEREGERSIQISRAIREFYFQDQHLSSRTRTRLMELYRDSLVTFSVVQSAQLLAEKGSQPVYLYVFNHSGSFSHHYVSSTRRPLGIGHQDDLIYLFHLSKLFPQFNNSDSRDAGMVRTLTSVWTNFANTGVPKTPCKSTVWQALQRGQESFLDLSRCPRVIPGLPFHDNMAFWASLFPPTPNGLRQQNY